MVKSCEECARVKTQPAKVPLHHWEDPMEAWQRIRADFDGAIEGVHLLIIVDALTKWIEIEIFRMAPTSETTIRSYEGIIARQGIPYRIVTDNATIFKSEQMAEFCKRNGIEQLFSAPYHPETNGIAERMVQTIKNRLKSMAEGAIENNIREIVFKYRATPQANGKTPAEMHIGRNLRTRLHMLKPTPETEEPRTQPETKRRFEEGQRVLSRNYVGTEKWVLGTILKRLGHLHYQVQLDRGNSVKRHVDQLRPTCIKQRSMEEAERGPIEKKHMVSFTLPAVENSQETFPEAPPGPAPQPPVGRSQRARRPAQRLNI